MADYGVRWHGARVLTLATEANITAMNKAAILVESDIKTHFTKVGTGKTYGRKRHIASAPGKPPAIDTGQLRASMMHEVSRTGLNVIGKVGVAAKSSTGTDLGYGLYLELGTNKIAPRPFLRPALKRTAKKVKRIFQAANK